MSFFSAQRDHDPFNEHQTHYADVKARRAARIAPATAFLRAGFEKISAEQEAALKSVSVSDFNADNVRAFEERLSLAYRMLITQADARFGSSNTDAALRECGHNSFGFRHDHKC